MEDFAQGDIIKIVGFRNPFLIVSKNAFIHAAHMFHVCPILPNISEGPLHISVSATNGIDGTVICEQIKLIDPNVLTCSKKDRIPYRALMNISDALQGIFEYD